MKEKTLRVFLLSAVLIVGNSAFAQVEQVTSITVTNPAAMIATIDQYLGSGENAANSVTLLSHMHDGVDPSTHTVVAIYDDLNTLESAMNRRATSAAWATLQRSVAGISTLNSSALAIQRQTWGDDSWDEGGYLAAVLVNVRDSASWLAALDQFNRASKVRNPGMRRVVRLRGGPATHAVLLASDSYAGLIDYMEKAEASAEFATMRSAAEANVVGTTIYRIAKVWNP